MPKARTHSAWAETARDSFPVLLFDYSSQSSQHDSERKKQQRQRPMSVLPSLAHPTFNLDVHLTPSFKSCVRPLVSKRRSLLGSFAACFIWFIVVLTVVIITITTMRHGLAINRLVANSVNVAIIIVHAMNVIATKGQRIFLMLYPAYSYAGPCWTHGELFLYARPGVLYLTWVFLCCDSFLYADLASFMLPGGWGGCGTACEA